MGKHKYSECSVWIFIGILVGSLPVNVTAQPGFISILCGGQANHTDENNIKWVTDDNYIDIGQRASTGDASLSFYLQNQRLFPKPLKKACYQLPIASNMPYLFRAWFLTANNGGFLNMFTFSVETLGMLRREEMAVGHDAVYYEFIFVSSGRMLYVCLTRTSESDPFINAIELRSLRDGMYAQAKPGSMLVAMSRNDVGGYYTVRYPHDNFDRIWGADRYSQDSYVSSVKPISDNNTKNLPPISVMQTAWATDQDSLGITVRPIYQFRKSLLVLYFAEIQMLNMSESRSFYVEINGEKRSDIITIVPYYSAMELAILSDKTNTCRFELYRAKNSTHGPILNAFEFFLIADTAQATYQQDVEALEAVKRRFDIKDWISDPCYLMEWEGIVCDSDNNSSFKRISEINLSGRNLTGFVPEDFGRLNAVVNLSLNNNHLTGPLPNFSNLTKLERLHLQDNNFSGSVPEWLYHLKNLKELFIENNNFSGVIPLQLLEKPSLELNYSGNHYLCMHKGECVKNIQATGSHLRKHKVVVGITLSGAVLIALASMVVIAVYRKKQGTKKRLTEGDSAMMMLPNSIIARAFILEDIVAATENFNRKIGEGGFGSVFFGRLSEGKEIAVKVLSSVSKQGVHEFMNEIDLLSRVHHKNLVSLLGYCNASREPMLIYDYMSGGSLRDRLYGPGSELSKLNWRTRLQIAFDAAQGLEYLHVDCTPKILHRDVKTSNILLDSNLNGKLADFGLSKMMAIDGDATHVTTTVKGTPGYLDPE